MSRAVSSTEEVAREATHALVDLGPPISPGPRSHQDPRGGLSLLCERHTRETWDASRSRRDFDAGRCEI